MKKTTTIITFIFMAVAIFSCTNKDNKSVEKSTEHHHHASGGNGERYSTKVNTGIIKTDTLKGSPHRTAMGNVDGRHIHITYSSPGTKGRVIWGGLVPLNQLWVAGAHDATKIRFSKNVKINGNRIKAGEYAFFVIPGKKSWTLIFNTNFDQHLTDDYKESDDVLRIQATPEKLSSPIQRLTYKVNRIPEGGGIVSMEWDYLKVSFLVTSTR